MDSLVEIEIHCWQVENFICILKIRQRILRIVLFYIYDFGFWVGFWCNIIHMYKLTVRIFRLFIFSLFSRMIGEFDSRLPNLMNGESPERANLISDGPSELDVISSRFVYGVGNSRTGDRFLIKVHGPYADRDFFMPSKRI